MVYTEERKSIQRYNNILDATNKALRVLPYVPTICWWRRNVGELLTLCGGIERYRTLKISRGFSQCQGFDVGNWCGFCDAVSTMSRIYGNSQCIGVCQEFLYKNPLDLYFPNYEGKQLRERRICLRPHLYSAPPPLPIPPSPVPCRPLSSLAVVIHYPFLPSSANVLPCCRRLLCI